MGHLDGSGGGGGGRVPTTIGGAPRPANGAQTMIGRRRSLIALTVLMARLVRPPAPPSPAPSAEWPQD